MSITRLQQLWQPGFYSFPKDITSITDNQPICWGCLATESMLHYSWYLQPFPCSYTIASPEHTCDQSAVSRRSALQKKLKMLPENSGSDLIACKRSSSVMVSGHAYREQRLYMTNRWITFLILPEVLTLGAEG